MAEAFRLDGVRALVTGASGGADEYTALLANELDDKNFKENRLRVTEILRKQNEMARALIVTRSVGGSGWKLDVESVPNRDPQSR